METRSHAAERYALRPKARRRPAARRARRPEPQHCLRTIVVVLSRGSDPVFVCGESFYGHAVICGEAVACEEAPPGAVAAEDLVTGGESVRTVPGKPSKCRVSSAP